MPSESSPRLVLLMGVAGSGKTTLGRLVAARLAYTFLDADDFHSPQAVARMRSGAHLSDEMRDEWIGRVQMELEKLYRDGTSCLLAFSGLRARHRRRLMKLGFATSAFMLTGKEDLLRQRITQRHDHFMPSSQLPHQLETMEQLEPDEGIEPIDISAQPRELVATLLAKLAS